jgi:hypothetical protein
MLAHVFEQRDGGGAERHAVLDAGLGLWDRPEPLIEIEVCPPHRRHMLAPATDDVSRPHGGQDREFEGACGNAVLLFQVEHEFGKPVIGQRGLVRVGADLGLAG